MVTWLGCPPPSLPITFLPSSPPRRGVATFYTKPGNRNRKCFQPQIQFYALQDILLLEYIIPPPAPWCDGFSLCYGVSPFYDVSSCYGVSLCYGVSPCYDVACVMVLSCLMVLARGMVLARVMVLSCVMVLARVMVLACVSMFEPFPQ